MAAWESMSDDAYDVAESYAIHVSPHSFYEWDGELEDAITTASILCDGIDAELRFEDAGIVLTVDQPDPEAVAVAGLREALAECLSILEQAEAA